MKQLMFIHGGEAFSRYDDFLVYLQNQELDPFKESSNRWHRKDSLESALGNEWQVLRPSMPNPQNSKYIEWKIWFERHLDFLEDGAVLVGYSQGAMFLARFLSDNILQFNCSKLILLAGAATPDGLEGEDGEKFYADLDKLSNISRQISNIHIYHSEDDFVVPFSNMHIFLKQIPQSKPFVFSDRNHFLQEDFPEFIADVTS